MEEAIEVYAIINFTMLGLSHIFQHRAWADFFAMLCRQGRPGAFINGMFTLIGGSLIVSFHNVWSGIPAVLTVIGWGFLLKSTLVFLFPDWGLKSMARVRPDNSHLLWVPGVVMIAVAALLAFSLWQRAGGAAATARDAFDSTAETAVARDGSPYHRASSPVIGSIRSFTVTAPTG